jgi:hypothetical protein
LIADPNSFAIIIKSARRLGFIINEEIDFASSILLLVAERIIVAK